MDYKEALIWCDDFRNNIINFGEQKPKYTLALRAMKTAMTAIARQIPRKVVGLVCPECERPFFLLHGQRKGADYCDRCGQKLKWED